MSIHAAIKRANQGKPVWCTFDVDTENFGVQEHFVHIQDKPPRSIDTASIFIPVEGAQFEEDLHRAWTSGDEFLDYEDCFGGTPYRLQEALAGDHGANIQRIAQEMVAAAGIH